MAENMSLESVGSLSSEERARGLELLRAALPACQPQEGSPANTFTDAELEALRSVLTELKIGPREAEDVKMMLPPAVASNSNLVDILDPDMWKGNAQDDSSDDTPVASNTSQLANPSDPENVEKTWYGAPQIPHGLTTQAFRQKVRQGIFNGPTNSQCPGFMQCNLVVLPEGPHAFDFLLFCQRNKKACPLIEVCDVGSPFPHGVARGADLRTDVPKYAIYRDGQLDREVNDVTEYWPERSIAFLIGCSFSCDGALQEAGIRLRSAEQKKNVPMYKTNLECRPAGSLRGKMVVSMKPIKALDIAKEVEITSKFPQAHGGPVCVGNPSVIGINDLDSPDWGEAVDVMSDEVPVFHACGVTPQSVLMESKVPFAITHSAGHMFVTDLPSDTTI